MESNLKPIGYNDLVKRYNLEVLTPQDFSENNGGTTEGWTAALTEIAVAWLANNYAAYTFNLAAERSPVVIEIKGSDQDGNTVAAQAY